MKTLQSRLIMLCSMATLLLITSCSVEKLADVFDCDSNSLLDEALVEKIFYQEALLAYAEDQSTANCQELKSSGNSYITAVEQYITCSKKGDEEIKRELRDAKKALAELGC